MKNLKEQVYKGKMEVKRVKKDLKRVSKLELDLQTNLDYHMSDMNITSVELLSLQSEREILGD